VLLGRQCGSHHALLLLGNVEGRRPETDASQTVAVGHNQTSQPTVLLLGGAAAPGSWLDLTAAITGGASARAAPRITPAKDEHQQRAVGAENAACARESGSRQSAAESGTTTAAVSWSVTAPSTMRCAGRDGQRAECPGSRSRSRFRLSTRQMWAGIWTGLPSVAIPGPAFAGHSEPVRTVEPTTSGFVFRLL
jgi:hypothetical protein